MVNGYAGYTVSERKFRKWARITVFVIPNAVRNLAGKREEILRFALNDKLMVNCYAWYTVSERGGTSPPAPLQRGKSGKTKKSV